MQYFFDTDNQSCGLVVHVNLATFRSDLIVSRVGLALMFVFLKANPSLLQL